MYCSENSLFYHGFADIKTASEFKDACTRPYRFTRLISQSAHQSTPIVELDGCTSTDLTLAHQGMLTVLDAPLGFGDAEQAQMIPGGRFLITVDREWLSLWDLDNLTETEDPQAPKLPSLAFKYFIEGFTDMYTASVVDNDRMWVPICREVAVTP